IQGNFYVGALSGWDITQVGNPKPTIRYYDGGLKDAYPLKENTQNQPLFGINGGYELIGHRGCPAIALGVGAYGSFAYNYHGKVIETATGDPSFLLYKYRFQIKSTRLMAEMQFNWAIKSWMPFVDVGIGPSWNTINHYSE